MTPTDPNADGSAVDSPIRWTSRRTRAAGIGAVAAGLAGLVPLTPAGTADVLGPDVGSAAGALGLLHPLAYALFAVALLAANARYGALYGRRGRTVAGLLALSLAGYAGTVLVAAAGRIVLGALPLPAGVLVGAAYLAIRALATAYGIVLWRCDGANRFAAALFALVLPAMFVLGPLTLVGFPAAWIESPIHLAFVALGYDLLSGDATPTAGGDGVVG